MPLSESSAPQPPLSPANTELSATSGVILTNEQIQGLLPHRYPFALVDRVIEH